jgi:phosphatidylglycerophosphate synthase
MFLRLRCFYERDLLPSVFIKSKETSMSVTCAYLLGTSLTDPAQDIAGLPLLLRTLFSLQEAGIKEVYLRDVSIDQLPGRERLTLNVTEAIPNQLTGPALVARVGVVWHPNLPKKLAQRDVATNEIVGFASGEAALYLAGEEALASLLESFADPTQEPTTEVPEAPEFLTVPSTPPEKKRTEDLLFASLIKPSDGLVSRWLNRRISFQVTKLVLGTNLTPNQMTIIAAIFGVVGVVLAWQGGFWGLVWGSFFYQMQSVLDGCDGEIARLKYLKSRVGEWLDQVLDDVINISFFVAVGHTLSLQVAQHYWTITLVVFTLHTLYQLSLYGAFWFKAKGRASVGALRWWGQGENGPQPEVPKASSPGQMLFGALAYFFENAGKRDFFTFAYLPLSLLGVVQVAFIWHGFIAALSGVVTTAQWVVSGGPEAVN